MRTNITDKFGKEICLGNKLILNGIREQHFIVRFGIHKDIAEGGCTSHTNIGYFIEDEEGNTCGLLNEEGGIDWRKVEIVREEK